MGRYTTLATTEDSYKQIIKTIEKGFITADGVKHRPNERVAFALKLEKVTGCRISDIVQMRPCDIVKDGTMYRLDIVEKKTGKKRKFTITSKTYRCIMDYVERHAIAFDKPIIGTTTRQIQKHLAYAVEYLGLDKINTHSLRKMAAWNIYEATGYDIVAVQKFLQHSSPSTTSQYLNSANTNLQKALSQMDM